MRITYDPEADAMYVRFAEGEFAENREVAEGIVLDISPSGQVLGIEILDVSRRYTLADLARLEVEMPLVTAP